MQQRSDPTQAVAQCGERKKRVQDYLDNLPTNGVHSSDESTGAKSSPDHVCSSDTDDALLIADQSEELAKYTALFEKLQVEVSVLQYNTALQIGRASCRERV